MKNKIKVFRAMHDMTQEELADRIRVTRRTINSIERGKYNPSIEVAYNIAKTFGVAIEEIFCFEDDEDAEARR
ncbi:MAG TPA: helix-turn-helix transcriptional regulator [Methanoculleus sp.]|jgi:putative transcriptional regulator|uniref:helix-turn-helix transcriptional regulator n=1 Tax=Methanoculleus sp. TaxID=90427 RepID=UPI000A7A70A5|nr:helix-turn-helix domain-containing protein [Methanoculleus sp.]MBP7144525.1 helix-turn-helix transcriptional regulator [Methanoculleus sp.]HNT09115.1 helix-turn-helix transcriptional regulator [Methanoculleus sp.]HOI61161.1 helix-turn-helix transcriptional regulator [Methanoculleus sp.]HQC34739.1 helix-turn-helix transcriptional regulator [Methanoculleus sp.]